MNRHLFPPPLRPRYCIAGFPMGAAMRKMGSIRVFVLTSVLATALVGGGVSAGPLEDGEAAYQTRDYETALRILRPLAENDSDPKAQILIGKMYARGYGVGQDKAEALRWYTLAADHGDPDAIMNLGDQYQSGAVVARDFEKAETLFRMSAEQGHMMSQVRLVYLYLGGEFSPDDALEAYAWTVVLESRGVSIGREMRGQVMAAMTRDSTEKGVALAKQYWDQYVVPFQN